MMTARALSAVACVGPVRVTDPLLGVVGSDARVPLSKWQTVRGTLLQMFFMSSHETSDEFVPNGPHPNLSIKCDLYIL